MKFVAAFALLSMLLATVSAAAAPPVADAEDATTVCDCGTGAQYDGGEVNGAILQASTTTGKYPHQFNNRENITLIPGCVKPFNEFPLKHGAAYMNGQPPGADRVIYTQNVTTSTTKFCGCVTHTGATGNNFVACKF